MQITKTHRDNVAILAIEGQLDATTAPQLDGELQTQMQPGGTQRILLDLAKVQLISSAALRVLLSAAKQMKKLQQTQILLCALTPEVQQVFKISGLTSLFDLYPSRSEALAALGIAEELPAPSAFIAAVTLPKTEPPPTVLEFPAALPVSLKPAPPPVLPNASVPTATAGASVAPPVFVTASTPPTTPQEKPAVLAALASASVIPAAPVLPPVTALPPVAATPPPPVAAFRPPPPPPPIVQALPRRPVSKPGNPALLIGLGTAAVLLAIVGGGYFALRSSQRSVVERPAKKSPTTIQPTPAATSDPTLAPAESELTITAPQPSNTPLATPAAVDLPTAGSVQAPAAVSFDASNAENQQTREAVLERISIMPFPQATKDRLYKAVDTARSMGKVATIGFDTGASDLSASAVESLKQTLQREDLQAFINNPTAVFIVLGFADSSGKAKKNQEASEQRAEKTVTALRNSCGLLNVMHAVGMGGSEFLGKGSREKNRVAEIWVVLP